MREGREEQARREETDAEDESSEATQAALKTAPKGMKAQGQAMSLLRQQLDIKELQKYMGLKGGSVWTSEAEEFMMYVDYNKVS